MAVLYMYENPAVTVDFYDRMAGQVRSEGTPEGALYHIACQREEGGMLVTEVWESEAAHDRFAEVLKEKIAKAGGPPRPTPRKLQVHNIMTAEKAPA